MFGITEGSPRLLPSLFLRPRTFSGSVQKGPYPLYPPSLCILLVAQVEMEEFYSGTVFVGEADFM